MATTVQNATLTSVITDSVTLNGTAYGGVTTSTLTNSDEVYQRIMTIPAIDPGRQDLVSLVGMTRVPNGAGDIDVSRFHYARFTNLDDNYPVYLTFTDNDGVCDSTPARITYGIVLPPGASYLLQSHVFLCNQGPIRGADMVDPANYNTTLTVYAGADPSSGQAGSDVEVFVVTK